MHFSINCSAVICSPTIIYAILREATSETYGPRVYFPSYNLLFYILLVSRQLAISVAVYFAIFTFQSIQQKYQKYLSYYLYQISLLRVTVKGLTTPLSCWLQGFVCEGYMVCIDMRVDLPGNGARNPSCYLLSMHWFSLEEERVMHHSSISISLTF